MTRARPFKRWAPLLLAAGLGFGIGIGATACVLPNPNHCQNLALDPNEWCAYYYAEDRPFCSPCAADHNGCVSAEPSEDECPGYSPLPTDPTDTGGATDTSGTGEETGGGTETGSETETGDSTETGTSG